MGFIGSLYLDKICCSLFSVILAFVLTVHLTNVYEHYVPGTILYWEGAAVNKTKCSGRHGENYFGRREVKESWKLLAIWGIYNFR